MRKLFCLSICLLAGGNGLAVAEEKIDFNRDIRPLLSDRCFACHGPEEKSREAGLRLDVRESAFGELESGELAIVPGDLDSSALVQRITDDDEFFRMPPPDSGKELKPEEIELLKRWVEAGAPWSEHWAFVAPERPEPPAVRNMEWPRNAIDRFILARLEREGLTSSPAADKTTLIRRVTFDLTGLPPTLEEIDAFLADDSPDAYEKVVDRLLKSPRYGEHMAHYWLDAARYGDTHGLHLDNYREMWPYRDWVVRAFNENKPYDEFIIEQLAGDLLPNPTQDQLVATGFNRCHVTTNEGGSIKQEVYVRNVVDRVVTTGTVMLGMTLDCTRCHDHKYDPLTQKDFYSLFAFFNSLDGNAMDGNKAQHPPVLSVLPPAAREEMSDVEEQIAAVEAKLRRPMPEVDAAQAKWEAKIRNSLGQEVAWQVIDPQDFTAANGSKLAKLEDKSLLASGPNPAKEIYEFTATLPVEDITAVRLEGLTHESLTAGGHGRSGNSNVVLSEFEVYVAPADKPDAFERVKLVDAWADHEQANGDFKIGNAIDGKSATGWATAGHEKREDRTAIFRTAEPLGSPGDRLKIRVRHESKYSQHQFGRIRLALTDAEHIPQLDRSSIPDNVLAAVRTEPGQRNEQHESLLRNYYRRNVAQHPDVARLQSELAKLEQRKAELEKSAGTTLVWKERAQPRDAFILKRGEYDQPGEKVSRDTPEVLPPLLEGAPRNRLGLAQWLVDPSHPLTARVAVNRFWQQAFGVGIVKTSEDFGSQGKPPTHPQLLDWLAVDFRESGWDVKRLMKQIVMSATYRQSSKVTPELLKRDPENRLLARGPRFRMDAEMLRDQALAVSGLLVNKVGGPSVKPPQPDGLWYAVGYSGSNTVRFKQDKGPEKVYRRTLYTFLKRTAPPPQMSTFDAPSRESCTVRRERTNTPLQMLLLMNDPQYVEAARALAQRTMNEAGKSPEDRIAYMFRLCTARRPTAEETEQLQSLYEEAYADFQAQEEAAAKLTTVGETPPPADMQRRELAAWTMVANLVLCLDEVVTKN